MSPSSVPGEILEVLGSARRVLVTSHVPPDGDGLGSGLALVRLLRARGVEAVFAAGGPVPSTLRSFVATGEIDTSADGPPGEFDVAVSLDSGTLERLRRLGPLCRRCGSFLNIDHHATNTRYGSTNWIDPDAAAVGEMIFRAMEALGVEPTPEVALPLYVAIVTDTGRFSYSNTTPETHRIAGALIATGISPVDATDRLYRSIPLSFLKLEAMAIEALQVSEDGLYAHLTATSEMVASAGVDPLDVGDLVDIPISVDGVEVGVLLREALEGRGTKLSLRSRRWFSVSDLAATWGGGGHPRAAGAVLQVPIDEARDLVITELARALAAAKAAGEGEA